MHFVKIYSSILSSTVWLESPETKVAWITLLAMADQNGRVWTSVPGLAHAANIPLDACRSALEAFQSPDPDSTTPDDEGRRIRVVDGGFEIINHSKYRDFQTPQQRRWAEQKRTQRAKAEGVDMSTMSTGHQETCEDSISTSISTSKSSLKEEVSTVSPTEFQTEWNEMAVVANVPQCHDMTTRRKATLATRSREPAWRDSFREALKRIPDSSFLTGKGGGDWKANIDWFLKPDSVTKILEGKYGGGDSPKTEAPLSREMQELIDRVGSAANA